MESNANANQNSTTTTGLSQPKQQNIYLAKCCVDFITSVLELLIYDGTINFEIRVHQSILVLHYRNKICGQRILYERVYPLTTFLTNGLYDSDKCLQLAKDFQIELNQYLNDTLK